MNEMPWWRVTRRGQHGYGWLCPYDWDRAGGRCLVLIAVCTGVPSYHSSFFTILFWGGTVFLLPLSFHRSSGIWYELSRSPDWPVLFTLPQSPDPLHSANTSQFSLRPAHWETTQSTPKSHQLSICVNSWGLIKKEPKCRFRKCLRFPRKIM